MAVREDVWLSAVLGYPVFAVEGQLDGELAPGFHYAKVDVVDVERVRSLAELGFSVVDVNVTLVRDPAAPVDPPGVAVEPARAEHREALMDIAGSCFRYSRFHLDPAIPPEAADRVKREWVRSYAEGRRGVELLVAPAGGRPVGFLAVLESNTVRAIDLIGVAPEAQGEGIGSALVAAFVSRHGPQASLLRVGTQIANFPSLRLYSRFGFAVKAAAYVLHRHSEGS